jgi:hypothetical protein
MTESDTLACEALMRVVTAVTAAAWIAMAAWPFFH